MIKKDPPQSCSKNNILAVNIYLITEIIAIIMIALINFFCDLSITIPSTTSPVKYGINI
jgi:hypothetical protein